MSPRFTLLLLMSLHRIFFSQSPHKIIIRMDQNLEPKSATEFSEVQAESISPEESGVYFLGESSSTSFVGYLSNEMADEEIQEYIDVQKRLAPLCLKEAQPRSQAPVDTNHMNAEVSSSKVGQADATSSEAAPLTQIYQVSPCYRSLKRKRPSRSHSLDRAQISSLHALLQRLSKA
jgi:hypothetical protein